MAQYQACIRRSQLALHLNNQNAISSPSPEENKTYYTEQLKRTLHDPDTLNHLIANFKTLVDQPDRIAIKKRTEILNTFLYANDPEEGCFGNLLLQSQWMSHFFDEAGDLKMPLPTAAELQPVVKMFQTLAKHNRKISEDKRCVLINNQMKKLNDSPDPLNTSDISTDSAESDTPPINFKRPDHALSVLKIRIAERAVYLLEQSSHQKNTVEACIDNSWKAFWAQAQTVEPSLNDALIQSPPTSPGTDPLNDAFIAEGEIPDLPTAFKALNKALKKVPGAVITNHIALINAVECIEKSLKDFTEYNIYTHQNPSNLLGNCSVGRLTPERSCVIS